MKIKTLMDFLNSDSSVSRSDQEVNGDEEKIIYIENARVETVREQADSRELLAGGTRWADQSMGDLLVDLGKLDQADVARIIEYQREKGIYFGEAAVDLKLVAHEDILYALSIQFGYTYDNNEESLSKEMVMACSPFGEQAEEFRIIRGQLLSKWLRPGQKTLAVVSPNSSEGRSYVAANLALAFSQLGRPTLLIDADMRAPRQHEMFGFKHGIGLSMLLAERISIEDLDLLPDKLSSFQHLSILGSGARPPNPAELLSKSTFSLILRELSKFFDVIIIDTPSANYQADVLSIAEVAGSALLVARSGRSKMAGIQNLKAILNEANINIAGAVLNQF